MKSLLKVLALFAFMYALYYLHHWSDMRTVRKDSSVFITDATTDIMLGWDPKEFAKYADPALISGHNIDAEFARYRTLGKLLKRSECEVQDVAPYKYPGTNIEYISATYQCSAEFEKGPATLQLTIYRFTNNIIWKILSFDVYSSYLTSAPAKPAASGKTR